MKLGITSGGVRCNDKLEFVMYADAVNYYIFHSLEFGFVKRLNAKHIDWLKTHALVVNGKTGIVQKRGRNRDQVWPQADGASHAFRMQRVNTGPQLRQT